MKNLRLFSTTAEADAAYANDYEEPWTSLTDENGEVRYNKEHLTYTFTWAGHDSFGTTEMAASVNHPYTCEIPAESYAAGEFTIPYDTQTGYTDLRTAFFNNDTRILWQNVRIGQDWSTATVASSVYVEGPSIVIKFDPNDVPSGPTTVFLDVMPGYHWTSDGRTERDT